MIKVMTDSYNLVGSETKIVVNDLAKACSTKSQAEITKEFVASSSYILRAAMGKDGKPAARKARAPLWDTK
jgi:hypothetical protein